MKSSGLLESRGIYICTDTGEIFLGAIPLGQYTAANLFYATQIVSPVTDADPTPLSSMEVGPALDELVQRINSDDIKISTLENKIYTNNAGQVKIYFDGLSVTGIDADDDTTDVPTVIMPIRDATSIRIVDAPTTTWPKQTIIDGNNTYDKGFFIQGATSADDRLRENNVMGQIHNWRISVRISNKNISNQGRLTCVLYNPDSGFSITDQIMLMAGEENLNFTFGNLKTIADHASLDQGRGYQLGFNSTFPDDGMTIMVSSIVRDSTATDIMEVGE